MRKITIITVFIICFLIVGIVIAKNHHTSYAKSIDWTNQKGTDITPAMVKEVSNDYLTFFISLLSYQRMNVSEPAPEDITKRFISSLRRDSMNIAKEYKVSVPKDARIYFDGGGACYMRLTKWGNSYPVFKENWVDLSSAIKFNPPLNKGNFPTIYFRNGSVGFDVDNSGKYTLKFQEGIEVKIYDKGWVMRNGEWKEEERAEILKKPPESNERADVNVSDLSLSGILTGNKPVAILMDKKTQQTYTLGVGDSIGHAKIEAIDSDKVTFDDDGEKIYLR